MLPEGAGWELEETKYEVPKQGEQLTMKEKTVHSEGTLTYMDSKDVLLFRINLRAYNYVHAIE